MYQHLCLANIVQELVAQTLAFVSVRYQPRDVNDLYGLPEALTTHKRGETVTIVFLRNGERMETQATLK